MDTVNWTLNMDDAEIDYLKETKEFICRLKNELMQKILSSSKNNNVIEMNSTDYNPER